MSKSTLRSVLVVAVVLAAIAAPTLAGVAVADSHDEGPPPVPAAYYGTATVNGDPIATGTEISAVVDGEVRDTITVDTAGEFGGSDAFAEKLVVENVSDGATVSFEVRGTTAAETVTWESGAVETLDLTFTDVSPPTTETPGGGGGGGDDDDDDDNGDGGGGGSGGGGGGGGDAGIPSVSTSGSVDATASMTDGTLNVNITNANAGDSVTIEQSTNTVDERLAQDGIAVESVMAAFAAETDFDMQISTGQDKPDSTVPTPPTDALGYISVDHSASDDALDQVEFTFRVSQARLDARGLSTDEVALYRYSGGQWTALETSFVETTADGSHQFQATSPGLSVFAIGSTRVQQTPTTTPATTDTPTTTPTAEPPTDTPGEGTSTDTPDEGEPTDTPGDQGGPGIPLIGGLVIVLLAIAGALYMVYGRD